MALGPLRRMTEPGDTAAERIEGVVFDLDGTLVDSCEDIARATNHCLAAAGLPERTHREIQGFIGDGARTYKELIQQRMGDAGALVENPTPSLAGTIAMVAAELAAEGVHSPPHAIRPLYVRRTDAELARDARAVG